VQECSGFANGRAAVREAEGDLGDVSLDAVGFEWHVDGSGVDSSTGRHRPISMLYCLEAPDAGGETLYLSGYHALEQLDAATRALAEQLTVHYGVETGGIRDAAEAAGVLDGSSMEHFRRYGDRMMPDGTRITNVPAAVVESGVRPTHTNPLVKCHPETGRPALWVSPRFVHHLEGPAAGEHWSVEESWAFLSRCIQASILDPDNVYGHAYRKGDVVLWDELCGTMHTTTVYEPPHMTGSQ
jgi:taurine dioxygenase